MITVKFYGLDAQAKDHKVGEIVFDGAKLVGSNPHMENIAQRPIVTVDEQHIDPTTEPELFMRELYKGYHSPYLRAMRAVET